MTTASAKKRTDVFTKAKRSEVRREWQRFAPIELVLIRVMRVHGRHSPEGTHLAHWHQDYARFPKKSGEFASRDAHLARRDGDVASFAAQHASFAADLVPFAAQHTSFAALHATFAAQHAAFAGNT
jgi:hypothetical protein